MSWIYHDFALEGTVLSVAEIKAGDRRRDHLDASLIPAYYHIIAVRDGIQLARVAREPAAAVAGAG